ncbi:WG repeat-containing protein [uncultured Bacteroides sp.]|jgi:hypothetical protein|uniref:WG repeat-containing protein n=1 Tax=uncultured Bacteroides sp. TaxID=162156 RepID=UPI0025F72DBA|nr:WG repeat-containing protein [uncultured Bacteroides sp.]
MLFQIIFVILSPKYDNLKQEKSQNPKTMTDKYDYIGDFNQGVAIVVKNNLYGVILMGGNEIIAPSYDYISPFKDGYAQAIRKGECKILDLSGRECKQYEGKLIAIPAKYDSVRDFKNGYACVQLNGKWGAIDVNCNEIYEPQFYFLSDFIEGTAKYKMKRSQYANSWGFLNADGFCSKCNLMEPEIESDGNLIIERHELLTKPNGSVYTTQYSSKRVRINNKGQLLVSNGTSLVALPENFLIAKNFENGLAVVQDSTGYWGAVDINGRVVIALQYTSIKRFSENKAFAIGKSGKLCIISSNGTIIKEFETYSDGDPFKGGYAIVSDNGKHGVINSNGKEILPPLDGYVHHTDNPYKFNITSSLFGGKQGLFLASTGLLVKPRFKKIIEVKKDCIKVEVDEIGETYIDLSGRVYVEKDGKTITFPNWCIGVKPLAPNIFLGIADNGRWGLLDGSGETLCMPTFDNIGEVDNDIIPLTKKEIITVGGWRKETKEITKYGLYNIKSKVFIPVEYDVCPEYSDGCYKVTSKGSLGAINEEGVVVLKTEWKQIQPSKGYYVVSKIVDEDYSKTERFGLTNINGGLILDIKYQAVSVLREGLYKVKKNNSWLIANDEGILTKETFDEIDIEDKYIIVSKNGLSARLNEHAEKLIKSEDGKYLILPSKFAWGYNFKDGIAKVIVDGCENFVDKSFNIVITSDNQIIPIDKSIDHIVSKDDLGNYIFVLDKKYGIINHTGEILIEAKYQHVSHLANKLYIAGIVKDGDYKITYGIIDLEDKAVLAFEYSTIKPYGGKVPRSYWSWDDEYVTEHIEIPENVEYWLVHKNGYGLIDRNGNICIQPIYEDIQRLEACFLVKENGKYGVISSDYVLVCNPKYSTVSSIGNGIWKVSIITSQTYNNKSEVFGILDSDGKEILEPIYQFIGNVNDERVAKGRAIINLKGQLGLVDENYCILAEPQFEHISEFKNGKATVNKRIFNQGVPGVTIIRGEIDINGTFTDIAESTKSEIINKAAEGKNTEVKIVKTLKNGFVVVQKNDPSPIYQYCAVLDKDNNIILPYKYHRIEEQENGMYLVYICTGHGGVYGLLNQDFQVIIAPKYAYIQQIQDVFVVKNSGWGTATTGLINSKGESILPCIYSSIDLAAPGLVWICKDNGESVGLATIEGKVLLAPTYGKVGTFKNGYAIVNNGHWYDDEDDDYPHRTSREFSMGKWGVIDAKGQLILSPIYDSISIEGNSYFFVSKSIHILQRNGNSSYKKVFGRYNKDGELIIKDIHGEYILASTKYDWQEDCDAEGRSRVYYKGNIGILNEKAQQIVSYQIEGKTFEFTLPEEYDWGHDSAYQFIIIEKNSKKGIIDCTNKVIVEPVFDQINVLSYGANIVFKCGVQNGNHNGYNPSYIWTIISTEGKSLIDTKSEEIVHIGFSLLAVKTDNNKYLIVDFNGQPTLDILFDSILSFGVSSSVPNRNSWMTPQKVDGLNYAIVGINEKFGIIDKQGRLTIHPKYSSLSIQNNNQFLADGVLINAFEQKIVVKDNSVLIMSEDYDTIEKLDNGILLVSKNKLFGCINQIGSVIIPLKYRSLTYQNNLLIALLYDETEDTYKLGVINFQECQIIPFGQQIKEIKVESNIILYKQDCHWGAYTPQGKVICEPIYDHIVYVADNLIKVGMDGEEYESYDDYYWEDGERYDFTNYREYSVINWGLIDNNGNKLLPIEYRAIADKVVDGLVEIRSNERVGYADVTGRILLEPTYKSIGDFVDGYAVVAKASYCYDEDGRDRERTVYGVVNSLFNEIIPCVFGSMEYEKGAGRFKTDVGYKTLDGRYVVEIDGKELLLDKKYKYCKPFGDTCAIAVRIADGHVKYGLVDKKSNDILPPIFSRLDFVENELYKFKINGLYGLVNSKGNIILQNVYSGIGKFEDNLACVQVNVPSDDRYEKKKLYGYVDSLGNEVLPPSYEFIGKRNNKYAVVMKNNLWGLFSIENHQLKIIPNAAFLGPCMGTLCKINIGGVYDKNNKKTTGGLWGYVSVDGQIVIAPTYDLAYGFSEGMAAVKQNGKWGFINAQGTIVVPCEYDELEASFENGKGKLVKDGEIYVFDQKGSQIDTYDQPRGDDDYYDGGYDDTPSIYDNPYYNDNLDMDQQSIEFWNSL